VFAVRVSPGGPTAAPDALPASDSAPATPNTVAALVRLFRFEFRLPCDMMEASHFSPTLMRNYIWATDARYGFRSSSGTLAIFARDPPRGAWIQLWYRASPTTCNPMA
jgi:hypothetical protein